ncbi:MAG: hypothetical protein K0Q95_1438 [Bacteroidota bacterium]|jgi:hypothetical protein|nr:hypothetical protein [Bacteroidota bacterium]
MKTLLSFIFLLSCTLTFGQNDKSKDQYAKNDSINSYWNFHRGRWGFLAIKEDFLAEQTEITIGEWLNYIYYSDLTKPITTTARKIPESIQNQLKNSPLDSTLLPINEFIISTQNHDLFTKCTTCDLLRIRSLDGFAFIPFNSALIKDKKSRKNLRNYLQHPIAGISYDQAVAFCKWRTTLDSLRWLPKIDSTSRGITTIDYDYACIYRLPTEEEFVRMNSQTDSINEKKTSNFNYKGALAPKTIDKDDQLDYGRRSINGYSHVLSKSSRHKNLKDVWNVQGNVAEMTLKKGVAKGGSYFHHAKDSYNKTEIIYTKPELWLGFRCVAIKRQK